MRLRSLALAALTLFAPLSFLAVPDLAEASVPTPAAGRAKDVVVQSDGKIVVAFQSGGDRFTIVRLRLDGTLDPTFGGDGIVETVIEPTMYSIIHDIALQPDGRIVAAGHVIKDANDSKFAIVRYRADGSLDPTFSGDGKVITDFVTHNGWNPAVDIAADGSIVAAGSDTSSAGILVSRYRADGSPDTSFDVDGAAILDFPGTWDDAADVAFDAAGNALVAGRMKLDFETPKQVLARVRPDGQLDAGFGNAGLVIWDSGHGGIQAARGVDIQGDGRIVVAGVTGYESFATLSRYLPTGQPDASFGNGGHVVSHVSYIGSSTVAGNDLALLRDGRIAVSSIIQYSGPSDVRLHVHTANGALDPAFDGDDGILDVDLSGQDRWDAGGFIAGTRDGKIVIAGTHADSSSDPGALEVVAVPGLYPVADVAVSIGATPNPAPAGPVEFIVRVRNDGPMAAPGAHLTFEGSQPSALISTSQGACKSLVPNTTTCTFGTLPVGAEAVVSLRTHVSGTEEGVFGYATVTANATDLDPADNFATTEVLVNPI